MRIAVCRPQTPFVWGGAEIFADDLVANLRTRGHEADLIAVPWQTWPNDRIVTAALLWRLLDLDAWAGAEMPIDLVIATKFPSYLVPHSNKVIWLVHQLRQAYELDSTDLGQFSESQEDREILRRIQTEDRAALAGARRLFATSRNVAGRLRASTGLEAEVLPHPPQDLPFATVSYEPFVLAVGPLDRRKRIDLLLEAVELVPGLRVVIAGEGRDRKRLEALAAVGSLSGRVEFAGRVPGAELAGLYARCRMVYYAPFDEDFGMVPYEAFRSEKPVVATTDSGGPLDVVLDGTTGRVTEPNPSALAEGLRALLDDEEAARAYGRNGRTATAAVNWDDTIATLLG
jgi:glycosyltransferase involved in cell wall biosynthesis